MKDADLIPESITVKGRGQDVVVIEPHFALPVRPLRGVVINLRAPRKSVEDLMPLINKTATPAEEIEFEREYPPRRVKKFGAALARHFKLPRKSWRVRHRRGDCSLFIYLWEGPGSKKDYDRMKKVMEYVEKNAGSI